MRIPFIRRFSYFFPVLADVKPSVSSKQPSRFSKPTAPCRLIVFDGVVKQN